MNCWGPLKYSSFCEFPFVKFPGRPPHTIPELPPSPAGELHQESVVSELTENKPMAAQAPHPIDMPFGGVLLRGPAKLLHRSSSTVSSGAETQIVPNSSHVAT